MKKNFTVPLVFLTVSNPSETNAGGGHGSIPGGQDQVRPTPMRFEEWAQSKYCVDLDGNGEVDFNDYAMWWGQSGIGSSSWSEYNPGAYWDDSYSG